MKHIREYIYVGVLCSTIAFIGTSIYPNPTEFQKKAVASLFFLGVSMIFSGSVAATGIYLSGGDEGDDSLQN